MDKNFQTVNGKELALLQIQEINLMAFGKYKEFLTITAIQSKELIYGKVEKNMRVVLRILKDMVKVNNI